MTTTCIAICNMSGIACASDADHTIYQLSARQPLAVAVNAFSHIPWDGVVEGYKRLGEPEAREDFSGYAKDFERYLSSLTPSKDYTGLTAEDANIIFMGYGKEDLFPRCYDTCVCQRDGRLAFDPERTGVFAVSHRKNAYINLLGNLDSVSTLIWGATNDVNDMLLENQVKNFGIYKQRVLEKFKGTEFEAFVTKKLDAFDAEEAFRMNIGAAVGETYAEVLEGIDTFSIEDLVTSVETIVNAEVRLDHLSSGCKSPLNRTREIAVITRAEGLTWLKHSLYAM